MSKNLDKEYESKQIIYEQQKEYRQTREGRIALRRAKERQTLKQMHKIKKSLGGGVLPSCAECGTKEYEVLIISYDVVTCYNCKNRRPKVLSEDEICR
jgi:hypothetical protein